MKKFISIFIIVFLTSCTLGPEYERPDNSAQEIEKFKNYSKKSGDEEISRWWTRIDDPLTEELVNKLIDQSYDIEASYAKLKQAIERSTIAGADLYPSLYANFDAGRLNTPGFDTVKNFGLGLSTSWELDLFGRTQSNIAGRTAEIEASIFEIDALIQSLIAQVVSQRITIAVNASKLTLVESVIDTREKTLQIVERRYNTGSNSVSALDVRLARENLASAKAELPSAEADLEESIYELDLLLGQAIGKSENLDYQKFSLLPPPRKIETPLPAALLDRRPDLRASELRAIAANADIGIAVADLYPNLTLSASITQNASKISDLLDSENAGWSLLGSITQKIFEAGKLRANIRLREAQTEELIANYKKGILTAVKEVETALLREEKLQKQVELLTINLTEAKHAERIASDRYAKGVGDILEVLNTQQRLWQTGQNLLDAQSANWRNRIALYLAIGGDWDFEKETLTIENDNDEKEGKIE